MTLTRNAGLTLVTLTLAGLSLASVPARADTLLQFNFENGQDNKGAFAATTTASGVASGSTLDHGTGFISDPGYSFLQNDYTVSGSSSVSLAADYAGGDYLTFSVTPTAGGALTLTGLSGDTISQGAVRNYYLKSSVG